MICSISRQTNQLAIAEPVGQCTGEDLRNVRRRFGNALDETDRQGRCTEHRHKVDGQQSVDHLGRDVHEHTDETERPDPRRKLDVQFRFGERRFNGHCSLRQKTVSLRDLAMKSFTRHTRLQRISHVSMHYQVVSRVYDLETRSFRSP